MKRAIVFDNSGTLTERYRALKDLRTNKICNYFDSLYVVDYRQSRALIVLQTDPTTCIINAKADQSIYEFMTRNNIDFGISYPNISVDKIDVLNILKNDKATVRDIQDTIKAVMAKGYDIQICSGSGFIININTGSVEFTITAGGKLFPEVLYVIPKLKERGIDIYVASGDRKGSLKKLAKIIKIPTSNVFGTADPKRKAIIIKELKKKYDKVMMVGDGPNDILAFKEANIGVLTLQQTNRISSKVLEAVDVVIDNIKEVLNIKF